MIPVPRSHPSPLAPARGGPGGLQRRRRDAIAASPPSTTRPRLGRRRARPKRRPRPSIPEDAMLAFAECMREHGVDMPDPQSRRRWQDDRVDRLRRAASRHRPEDDAGGARGVRAPHAGAAGRRSVADVPRGAGRSCSHSPSACASTASTCPTRDFGSGGGPVDDRRRRRSAFDSPTFKAADEACRSMRARTRCPASSAVAPAGPASVARVPIRAARPTPDRVSTSSRRMRRRPDRAGAARSWRPSASWRSGQSPAVGLGLLPTRSSAADGAACRVDRAAQHRDRGNARR